VSVAGVSPGRTSLSPLVVSRESRHPLVTVARKPEVSISREDGSPDTLPAVRKIAKIVRISVIVPSFNG
jgi:hypothetical protein